jgi:hypothetical protein
MIFFLYETYFFKNKKIVIGMWSRNSKSRLLTTKDGISFF